MGKKGSLHAQNHLTDELAQYRSILALLPPRHVAMQQVPIGHIRSNPYQARQKDVKSTKLVQAIRAENVIVPLRVRPDPLHPGCFQVVCGERWLSAARTIGLKIMPCEVGSYSDDELFDIGLAENIQQQDLDPLEEAFALRTMMEQRGCSVQQLTQIIGKDETYIVERLALLSPATPEQYEHPLDIRYRPAVKTVGNGHNVGSTIPPNTSPHQLPPPAADNQQVPAISADQRMEQEYAPSVHPNRIRRTIDLDIQTLRTTFARWHALLDQQDTDSSILRDYLDEVFAEVERLAARLDRSAL